VNADAGFDVTFREVLEDVLGWGLDLREEDSPATIEAWDSLAQIRLVHTLETRFDVRLPDAALLEEHTVASLRDMVRERAAVA
jgi:acyl carrier protein